MNVINLHILVGLPCCGKTWYTKQIPQDDKVIIHMDDYGSKYLSSGILYNYKDKIFNSVNCTFNSEDNTYTAKPEDNPICDFYIDGLYVKDLDYADIVLSFLGSYKELIPLANGKWTKDVQVNVTYHYWNPSKRKCLINDKIKHRVYKLQHYINSIECPVPDHELIYRIINDPCVHIEDDIWHETNTIDPINEYIADWTEYSENGFVLYSEDWNKVTSDPVCGFDTLEELMKRIDPDITLQTYNTIYNECKVRLATWDVVNEWGTSTYNRWEVDIDDLKEVLKRHGYSNKIVI